LATFTVTIQNSLKVYGQEPTNLWGVMVWGDDVWGWRDVEWQFQKNLSESINLTQSQYKNVHHKVDVGMTFDTVLSRQFPYRVYESVSLSSAITSVKVINNGWFVTKGGETNALNWPTDQFTKVSATTTDWTRTSLTTTDWVRS